LRAAVTAPAAADAGAPAANTPAGKAEGDVADDGEEGLLQALDDFGDDAVEARDVFKSIVRQIPTIHDTILATLRAKGGDNGLAWIPATLAAIGVAVFAGLVGAVLLARWGRRQFASLYEAEVFARADKIIYLYLRALLMLLGVAVFFAVSVAVYLMRSERAWSPPTRPRW
jgi:hypothetical protein